LNKPFWALAGVALLGTIGISGVVIVASSGGEEEAVQQVQTATAPAPSPTHSASPAATETAAPTSTPSVPEDWPTYSDPAGLFTIRYPATWFQSAGQAQFSSYDLSTLTTTQRPREALVVEVAYSTAAGISNCGVLSIDPKSGEGAPDPGATQTSLGGVPAWQIVSTEGDAALEGDLTRAQTISVVYQGYCLVVAGYFTQQAPDVGTFVQVASSFQFTF